MYGSKFFDGSRWRRKRLRRIDNPDSPHYVHKSRRLPLYRENQAILARLDKRCAIKENEQMVFDFWDGLTKS